MADGLYLAPKHRTELEALLREHLPGVEVWAFGSRVSGRSHDGSDLDLVLRGPGLKEIPLGQVGNFEAAVRDSSIPFLVEVRDWARLPEGFHQEIERGYVVLAESEGDDAGSEWHEVPVSKVAIAVIGGTPARSAVEYWGGDIPWATAKDIAAVSSRYLDQVQECITEQGLESSSAKLMSEGTVVITARGTVGALAQLRREMTFNQTCYAILPKDGLDSDFLYWAMKGTLSEMRSLTYGTVFETITRRTFDNWRIPLPPLPEQRAIAHILGTLDDKIELNRRMNATLEAMARALFKSWFVDFDPVRAKAALRKHAAHHSATPSQGERDWSIERARAYLDQMDPEIAALFPDRFVDSELGEIPKGWEMKALPELIEINPKRSLQQGELAPCLDMANMPTRGHVPDTVIDRPFNSGMRFVNGDTLVARITPCLENGKTAYIDFLRDGEIGWGSTEYIVMRPKSPLPNEFAYCLARSDRFRDFAIQNMTGTSGRQRVPAKALSQFILPLLPEQIAESFGKAVQPLLERASRAVHESRILAALRDTLLPKLISGDLLLRDREEGQTCGYER